MIRTARPGDVPALLELIRELAAYEREPEAVETTADALHAALFGPDPQVFAHVAEDGGRVVGCAVWYVTYSTWTGRHGIHLEDLVVTEAARGGGHGRALVAELARTCVERGWPRLEWQVLDWNEPAIGFYRAIGALALDEWTGQRVTGGALQRLAAG